MLTLSGISKRFGGRTLFADTTLQVNRQDRIGLVGPNGAGKSTLFQLVLGQEHPDEGQVLLERHVSVGYLPQESAPVSGESVLEVAMAVDPDMAGLLRQMAEWDAHPDAAARHDASPHALFAERGGHEIAAKAKRMLACLGFREKDFARPARELSGGWVMRAHLARLLVREPDLLLLDEPTNHLDLEALLWFQGFLQRYPGALVVISHDREFLNQLVGSIVEIRQNRLIRYRGNYEDYVAQREAHEAQLLAAYKNQQREIARLMVFVNRFRAKNTKATQAQSKLKQIDRMEKIEAPGSEGPEVHFRFPQPPRSGLKAITLKGVDHAYGELVVYRGLDFQAERGQRIVLVGPNGAGKSTLLKLLAGVLPVQAGTREPGHNVKVGYYSQYRAETLHPDWTVLEEALTTPQPVTEQFVRTVLGGFLFHDDDVFKRVRVLSGGEKSRLALVKLLLDPPNLLLMDEPTTHLDMSSIDALLAALDQFEGTLVFISHDVYFIKSIANHVVRVDGGRLTAFPGGFQYYLDKMALSEKEAATAGGNRAAAVAATAEPGARGRQQSRQQKRLEAEQRQDRYRLRKAQQATVARIEKEVHELERRQAELTSELQRPETYQEEGRARDLNLAIAKVTRRLGEALREWEIEADKLGAMD